MFYDIYSIFTSIGFADGLIGDWLPSLLASASCIFIVAMPFLIVYWLFKLVCGGFR